MSELKGRTQKEISDMAAQAGLVTFFPKPCELMIDIDEPYATASVKLGAKLGSGPVAITLRKANIHILGQLFTVSKSGNLHAYVDLDMDIEDHERIIIQAAFRSDPVRDILSLMRLREGNQEHYHMSLFETEDQAKLVKIWRRACLMEKAKTRIYRAKINILTAEMNNNLPW